MAVKKSKNLKRIFINYILSIIIIFVLCMVGFVLAINLLFQTGLIIPANYTENAINKQYNEIQNVQHVTEDILPKYTNYVVFDYNLNVLYGNLDNKFIGEAKKAVNNKYLAYNTKQYVVIKRKNDICVIQYYLLPRYKLDYLNKYFFNVNFLFIVIPIILLIITIIIATKINANRFVLSLKKLNNVTEKIKEQNLDFDVEYSNIKEIDDVILSMDDMKNELKHSLKKQWKLQKLRKEQISSLAHDTKTPITIVKGNAELLNDTNLDNEQRCYLKYINSNIRTIEDYIQILMEIDNSENPYNFNPESIDCEQFIKDIYDKSISLAGLKKVNIVINKKNIPKIITVDKDLLKRAVMNIISNALDYSKKDGQILLDFYSDSKTFSIRVTDYGRGFSKEDLKNGTNEFYMGNKSRSSKNHYGIGLFTAQKIVNNHNGKLKLANSKVTGGGEVTIEIIMK